MDYDTPERQAKRSEEIIATILPNAKKGDSAWKRIERLQAEDGDFNAGVDIGFEPRSNNK